MTSSARVLEQTRFQSEPRLAQPPVEILLLPGTHGWVRVLDGVECLVPAKPHQSAQHREPEGRFVVRRSRRLAEVDDNLLTGRIHHRGASSHEASEVHRARSLSGHAPVKEGELTVT